MSNNLLRFIPTDPYYMPDIQAQHQARELFATFVPQAYEVRLKVTDTPAIFDAGANLERLCALLAELCLITSGGRKRLIGHITIGISPISLSALLAVIHSVP